jgi:adenosylcobinamide kinase/adenosylcobinamide-phosphate guanylyltransferase
MLTLVLGGIRSGKSRTAAALATGEVVFVATGQATDAEMASRIAEHRRLRPPDWRTVEEPLNPSRAELPLGATVLLDSVDSLVANWLLAGADAAQAERGAVAEVLGLAGGHLIVVSCEAGFAPVALSPLGRAFQDALGRANQALAARADRVLLCIAGIPVTVK